MLIVYSNTHRLHDPPYEIYDGERVNYAESAGRANQIIDSIRGNRSDKIIAPRHFPDRHLLAIHQPAYVNFLRQRSESLNGSVLYPSYFISDTYAPITAGTFRAARGAVDVSLTGAERLKAGERIVYCLCRPPGHHSEYNSMGGYCYFNNAAIAANYLAGHGRVAILDIDFHHGNGTQAAFYDRSDVLYVSLHADPRDRYPYSSGFANEKGSAQGLGYNYNYPLSLGTTDLVYLRYLSKALRVISDFRPDYLIVSAGFDTYVDDPIGGFELTEKVYYEIGQRIAGLDIPSLLIQEGGYNVEHLGDLVTNFLNGVVG